MKISKVLKITKDHPKKAQVGGSRRDFTFHFPTQDHRSQRDNGSSLIFVDYSGT